MYHWLLPSCATATHVEFCCCRSPWRPLLAGERGGRHRRRAAEDAVRLGSRRHQRPRRRHRRAQRDADPASGGDVQRPPTAGGGTTHGREAGDGGQCDQHAGGGRDARSHRGAAARHCADRE